LIHANSAQAALLPRRKPRAAEIDVLDGPSSIIIVTEAPERRREGE